MIRTAQKNDIDDLIPLLKELFEIEKDFTFNAEKHRKGLEMIIENYSSAIFIFEIENNAVAMCSVQLLISSVEGKYSTVVEDVVVKNEERGKGIGKKLLSAVDRWSKEKGSSRVTLLADKYNQPALEFYKTLNFNTTRMVSLKKNLEAISK